MKHRAATRQQQSGIALLMLLSALKPLLGLDRHAAWAALDWGAGR